MKYLYFIVLLFLGASCDLINQAHKFSAKQYFRYQVESAHVVYAISGMKKGTEELFFDQYGLRQLRVSSNRIMLGAEMREMKTVTITIADSVFMLNLNDNTGRALKDRLLFDVADSLGTKDLGAADIFLQSRESGLMLVGSERWLSKECQVYQLSDSSLKLWIWNNIPLRIESEILGVKNVVEATRIQTELAIPKSKFEIPLGIKILNE
jgi:hypothetical protein